MKLDLDCEAHSSAPGWIWQQDPGQVVSCPICKKVGLNEDYWEDYMRPCTPSTVLSTQYILSSLPSINFFWQDVLLHHFCGIKEL